MLAAEVGLFWVPASSGGVLSKPCLEPAQGLNPSPFILHRVHTQPGFSAASLAAAPAISYNTHAPRPEVRLSLICIGVVSVGLLYRHASAWFPLFTQCAVCVQQACCLGLSRKCGIAVLSWGDDASTISQSILHLRQQLPQLLYSSAIHCMTFWCTCCPYFLDVTWWCV